MGASIGPCTLVCRPRGLGGDGPCIQVGTVEGTLLDTGLGEETNCSSCAQVFWGLW